MKTLIAAFCFAAVLASLVHAQTAPTISSVSDSRSHTQGEAMSLSVSVNGTAPFTYVWKKGVATIVGATTSSYTIPSIGVSDAGSYTVTITNAGGSITSAPILIDVIPATAPVAYGSSSNHQFTVGDTLNLWASVNGTQPLTFEWKKGDTVVQTGPNSYYSKANVQVADSGSYTYVVTNVAGSATSAPYVVTVNPLAAPVFSSGPSDVSVAPGNYVSLAGYVSNSTGVTYQWYKDDNAIPNATGNSLFIWNAAAADAGSYKVVATNSAGSATSSAALVTVLSPTAPSNISITSGPVTVTTGEALSLSNWSIVGTQPITYQWRKDGVDIPGATSSSYYKAAVTATDTGSYSLVATNSAGSATSNTVSVSVSAAQQPIITFHPTGTTVYPGFSLSLSVSATGTGNLSYVWKKDDVVIPNSSSNYIFISSSATASDAGTYTVTVSNTEGSTTSQPALVVVLPAVPPTITRHPFSAAILPKESLNLSVEAAGYPSPTYQWKKDGVDIPNTNSSSYWLGETASSDSGVYSVVVTNSAGSATSHAATVTVDTPSAPVILGHPASASLLLGQYHGVAVFYATPGATVQWYRNGVAIPNANSNSYTIGNAQPSHAGTYKAVVTNSAGSTTSLESTITIDLSSVRPPIIFTSGSEQVRGGSSAVATINVAPDITNYTVVWKRNGVVIPNANLTTLYLQNFSSVFTGTYTAEVTVGSNTYTSQPIVLSLQDAGVSPRIVYHPASLVRNVGEWASFSVVATGEQILTYQWKKDGADIPNANGDNYSIQPSASAASAGNYSVLVTNVNGSTTSNVASLTVNSGSSIPAPIISQHPASQTLTAGTSNLSLYVSLWNSLGNETFQWYKDGAAISGAIYSNYYDSSTSLVGTAARYKVSVTNSGGTTMSSEAIISVTARSTGPSFTTQPLSQSAYTGTSVTFTSLATSGMAVTYQWRKNGVPISGATSPSLTLSNLTMAEAGSYTVVAADANGSVGSSVAQLTLTASIAPIIAVQPISQVGVVGGSVSFNVTASGTPAPSYQWKKNGVDISGATGATLSLTTLATGDDGSYQVVISNSGGSTSSNSVSLTVFSQQPLAPVITAHPQSGSYGSSVSVNLSVSVSGFPAPAIQWYKNGGIISGAQSTTLALGQMHPSLAGSYHAVATNILGSATSSAAIVSVSAETERLLNVSSRGTAGKDSNTLIAGFVINGGSKKNILLRAVGPTLIPLGVSTALTNPRLQLFKGSTVIMENDDWSTGSSTTAMAAAFTRLGAHPLPIGTADAALMVSLDPGVYTAHVTTNDASTGVALLEVYDADEAGQSGAKVVNLSSRGPVGRGDDILIVGFVINGATPKKVLIRGVGPALTALGVTGALADPKLQLFKGSTVIHENDDWSAGSNANEMLLAVTSTGASGLAAGSKDAAILVSLAPGVYSAHVRGVNDTTGVALIEVYDVP